MKRALVVLMAAMAAMFVASPAMAQATRTWVSGVGDDVNPCSRTAPCKTFAGAISKTAAGGEIDCLDPGGFGTVTITKSITIDCTGTFGSVLASATNGVNVNDSATGTPGTIKVVLRGLSINGAGTTLGLNGVKVSSAREVLITNSIISNFSTAGVAITGATKVRVMIDNSTITGAAIGVLETATTFGNSVKIVDTTINASGTAGIQLNGALATGFMSGVTVSGAPKALDLTGGAVMNSYGNNVLDGAAASSAPTPTPLQ